MHEPIGSPTEGRPSGARSARSGVVAAGVGVVGAGDAIRGVTKLLLIESGGGR